MDGVSEVDPKKGIVYLVDLQLLQQRSRNGAVLARDSRQVVRTETKVGSIL